MRNLLIFFLFIVSLTLRSEDKIQLCSEFKNDVFSGFHPSWSIDKSGNFMYVVYQSDKPILDTIIINIFKNYSRKDSNYYYYDYYYLIPDSTNNKQAYNKYVFNSPGNYKISAFENKSGFFLQSHTTTILYNNSEYINKNFTDTWYYSESGIAFCDSLSEKGELLGRKNSFLKKSDKNIVVMYIEQPEEKPFHTDHLYIKIFKENEKCIELYDTFSSEINRDWFWTNVNLQLNAVGTYNVEVYTQDDILINTGRFEIK